MAELKKAADGDSGFGEAGEGLCRRDAKAGRGGVGVRGLTKLLYVTPEMLVKNGKLASALEALACRCCEKCVAMRCSWCERTRGQLVGPWTRLCSPVELIPFSCHFYPVCFSYVLLLAFVHVQSRLIFGSWFKGCEISLRRATAVDQGGLAVEARGSFREFWCIVAV